MKFFTFIEIFKILFSVWTTSFIFSSKAYAGNTVEASDSSYFFYQQSEYPRDCKEVFAQCSSSNPSSGVYYIKPEGYLEPFEVFCANTEDYEGWTVIQKRQMDGSVSFNRDWESYKHGFGFPSLEFWIGNEKLSFLTSQKKYQLLIEMTSSDGSTFNVTYNNFRISDSASEYKLVSLDQYTQNGEVDHLMWCPSDLHYGDCTCGKRTCEEPGVCLDTCAVGLPDYCVPCPEGYYMKGEDCVPQRECGCYVEDDSTVITEDQVYVNEDCTRRSLCSNGTLASNGFGCSTDTVCSEQNDVRGCYCRDGYSGNNVICLPQGATRDCQDLYDAGIHDSGVYTILPTHWPGLAFPVYCNMTDGGGWTVFQRRVDGTEDFYLDWAHYKRGFGNLTHEFWLGNEKLFYLTNQRNYRIRIDLVNREGAPYYAKFTSFRINSESDNYRLSSIGTYSGTADDQSTPNGYALTYHRGYQFSTKDRDNDVHSSLHCARDYNHGAWWYKNCYYSNLNGDYNAPTDNDHALYWYYLPGPDYNIKYTDMKIRPI